ncbi:MAG: hypothetical protein JSV00_08990 [bacterium]|nr:MAG: hypothetical protein JSV00_08990 [bacterium]
MGILSTEIEKVVLCSGEREVISEEDLSVSVPGGVGVVFGLLDALGDGDRTEALAALRSLMDADNPPEYLVHMMAWHYRQLLRGKELVHSGLTPFEAASRLGKRFQGLKEKFARHMGRATEGGLERALESLSRCDRQLKTGRIPERTLLDRLVLDLLV